MEQGLPWAFLVGQTVKSPSAMREMQVRSLGMAAQSRALAWRLPQTEESGGLQSMGWSQSQTGLSD